MTKSRVVAIGIVFALIAPLASAGGSRSHGGPIGMTVKVSDAWLAPTEDGRGARMYMDVVTSENAKLTYAFTREAKKVELRETRLIDGVSKDQHASWIQTWAAKPTQVCCGRQLFTRHRHQAAARQRRNTHADHALRRRQCTTPIR